MTLQSEQTSSDISTVHSAPISRSSEHRRRRSTRTYVHAECYVTGNNIIQIVRRRTTLLTYEHNRRGFFVARRFRPIVGRRHLRVRVFRRRATVVVRYDNRRPGRKQKARNKTTGGRYFPRRKHTPTRERSRVYEHIFRNRPAAAVFSPYVFGHDRR